MTEQVFGLTSAAVNLLNQMADKHRQRLPDAGRRTRRVDEGGGESSRLVYITQDVDGATGGDPYWFARGNSSISIICHADAGATGTQYEVWITCEPGVWFTGQRVEIVRMRDAENPDRKWQLVSTGISAWIGTALGDNASDGIELTSPEGTFVTVPPASVLMFDSTFTVEDQHSVYVHYQQQSNAFYIMAATCPPVGS